MTALGDRMRTAREALGLQQEDVGVAANYDQTTISDIEGGKTASPRNWRALARVLEIPEAEFRELMEITRVELGKTERMPKGSPRGGSASIQVMQAPEGGERDVPVYGRACGGTDGRYEFNGEVVGWEIRPPSLRGVRDAYSLYVDGESMFPRYKPGEAVFMHPGRPPRPGDDVIVQLAPDIEGGAPYGFIKEFVGYRGNRLVLKQWNPETEIAFERSDVVSVHPIVFSQRA